MSLLLCFSGQIGSGKSSVSTAVSEALGWRRAGFGDFLRNEVARLGGDPNDRRALQDLGQAFVDKDPSAFCHDVLASGGFHAGDDFVIDGVRHVGIFDLLSKIATPSRSRLIFLGALETSRIARVEARPDALDFARASRHSVEAELSEALPQRADGIVDANQSLDVVVDACLRWVHRWKGRG